MSTHSADVIIIGGGLVGWSAGYELARRGMGVLVADRGEPGFATQAAAGIIAPGASLRSLPQISPLAIAAMRHYPDLLQRLEDSQAVDTGYRTVGALFVAMDETEAETLPDVMRTITARKADGLGNIGDVTLLSGSEASELFPALADLPAAIHLSAAARLDGRLLRVALKRAALSEGAQDLSGDAVVRRDGATVSVTVSGEAVRAGAVVIAAGAWSRPIGEQIGVSIPVDPQRGQIVHLAMPDTETETWPIVEGYHTHYILTFGPNRVVCGATRERDSGYDLRLTAGGQHEVLGEALRVAPGLSTGSIAEWRVGLRPFSADQLPILGAVPGVDNLFVCTGHGPAGLTLGPYSGAAVAQLIAGETPEADLSPFSVARFAR
ncbi:MAG: NAD(P)/FAD-dependent oxidoreductase [Thermomicrobiales bacterium]